MPTIAAKQKSCGMGSCGHRIQRSILSIGNLCPHAQPIWNLLFAGMLFARGALVAIDSLLARAPCCLSFRPFPGGSDEIAMSRKVSFIELP